MLKCFLLFYNWQCSELSTTLTDQHVLGFTRTEFLAYCGSPGCYHDIQVAEGLAPVTPLGVKPAPGIAESLGSLTLQEFRRGVKRDKSHYEDLKDDKYLTLGIGVLLQLHVCTKYTWFWMRITLQQVKRNMLFSWKCKYSCTQC